MWAISGSSDHAGRWGRGSLHPIAEQDLLFGLIALGLILVLGRGAGDLARRLNQPEVLGQLVAGFLLGPSVFGAFLPGLYHTLFLRAAVGTWLSGLSWIGAILLLLIAGIEVDLNILRQEARPGALTALFAIVPSLAAGAVLGSITLGNNGYFLGVVLSVTAVGVATHGPAQDVNLQGIVVKPGKYYSAKDPKQLPAIYIKESRLVSQSFVHEKRFLPVLAFRSGPTDKLPDPLPLGGSCAPPPRRRRWWRSPS